MRSLLALAVSFALCGCVSFLPPQSADVYKDLNQTVDALVEMRATTGLPGADTSYAKMQPLYARAYAGLDAAQATAGERAQASQQRLFGRPAKISELSISNCRQSIDLLVRKNIGSDLKPDDFASFPVISTCAIPQLIEGDLKRGS